MDKIQLIFFFLSGFLISRLLIKAHLPERLVFSLIGERAQSLTRVLFYILATSALLSFFIPNVITVLTLLPVLELLRRAYVSAGSSPGSIATMITLAAIYGANIGGMGSVTATPANGILVTYAQLNGIGGSPLISFAGWLLWGIPLVFCFVIAAWLVLIAVFRPWRFLRGKIVLPFTAGGIAHPWQRLVLLFAALYFLSSLALSALILLFPAYTLAIVIFTGVVTLLLTAFLFLIPIRLRSTREPMLRLADCYSNLPGRGFIFIGIAIALAGILYLLGLNNILSDWIAQNFPGGLPPFMLFLLLAIATSLGTEVLSNTAVQISLFVVIVPLSVSLDFPTLAAMTVITLSSTCAFMSPIATGVNGLAFGGIRDVSALQMFMAGLVMNIVGAVIIAFWITSFPGWLGYSG